MVLHFDDEKRHAVVPFGVWMAHRMPVQFHVCAVFLNDLIQLSAF